MKRILFYTFFIICPLLAQAQVELRTEAQVTGAMGDHNPLWLNANKYGLSSLKKGNGYVRVGAFRSLDNDSARNWRWGAGADVAVAAGFTSTLVVQQAYGELQWKLFNLMAGAKELPMTHKNPELSTGSQTFGINARPIPQVRLAMDYLSIPYTRNWVAFRFFGSYGMTTDDGWQKDFTHRESRYTEKTLFHTKAAFLRIGPKNITFELGLEMGCQFGGRTLQYDPDRPLIEHNSNLKAFINALTAQGTDKTDGEYINSEGNHVGSWVAKLNIDQPTWNLGLYADQFFEDNSMMVHVAYNGWGEGATAYQKVDKKRYFGYDFKDWLLGAELKLKEFDWLNDIVVEYMYTKYQGGPVYHDITNSMGEHITGIDHYYNHHLFTGWQHWGQVIGNPLYQSPLYNDDGLIEVENNRFVACHLGLSGDPLDRLHYRLLATWQKGYGTYYRLYPDPRQSVSLMGEATYTFSDTSRFSGWHVTGALGLDAGKLRGNNFGVQLTVGKTFEL